jgi:aryl-alcohol dehydrogenase-like predicted oxidoreductase
VHRRKFLAGLSTWVWSIALGGSSVGVGVEQQPNASADAGTNAPGLPLRVLGRTGQKVTIVGLGTACIGHAMPGPAVGVPVYRAALEAGITLIDTARGYDDAESYLGQLMPEWRDKIFLTTKAAPHGATPKEAAQALQRQLDQSLRLLRTDYVDLFYLHNVGAYDPDIICGAGGPLDLAMKLKEAGKIRFIGISGHCRVLRFKPILQTGAIDLVMVVLNFVDYHIYPFEEQILPVARDHGCGVLAMKVFGGSQRRLCRVSASRAQQDACCQTAGGAALQPEHIRRGWGGAGRLLGCRGASKCGLGQELPAVVG